MTIKNKIKNNNNLFKILNKKSPKDRFQELIYFKTKNINRNIFHQEFDMD